MMKMTVTYIARRKEDNKQSTTMTNLKTIYVVACKTVLRRVERNATYGKKGMGKNGEKSMFSKLMSCSID